MRALPAEWRDASYRWMSRKPANRALFVFTNDPRFGLVATTTIDFLNGTLKAHPEFLIYMAMEVVNRPDLGAFE